MSIQADFTVEETIINAPITLAKDAYQLAVEAGVFTGTREEFNALLGQATVGPKGDKGDPGDPGPQGIQGEKGDKGDQGDPGPAGAKGDTGDPGATGAAGAAGAKGDKGDQGDPGAPGAPGADAPDRWGNVSSIEFNEATGELRVAVGSNVYFGLLVPVPS